MRKAVFVGINDYGNPDANLRGCIPDATAMSTLLETNGDGSPNFDCQLYTDYQAGTKAKLISTVLDLFKGDHEIALFYFSGHGMRNEIDTYLVTPDWEKYSPGLSVTDLMKIVNESECKNKIVILDCCHSGATGGANIIGDEASILGSGVTILAASKDTEASLEVNGHGIFTNLLLDALQGGAADVSGNISPGAVYSYIDKSLGAHDQRPVFKTNITKFVRLRKMSPVVPEPVIRKLIKYFPTPGHEYSLDPSYEDTNSPDVKPLIRKPYASEEHVAIFKELQLMQSVGLISPVEAPFMYFAAMESKACKLTALGHHYWNLVKAKRI